MEYFKHNLPVDKNLGYGNTKKWLLEKPYTPKKSKRISPFTKQEYKLNKSKYLHFEWIDDQFVCANPKCKSENVKCTWFKYEPIDMGVDDTFGEFYCMDCGKYTFVEYNRDSS